MADKQIKVTIGFPVLELDFKAIVKLVAKNITKDVSCGIDYYKSSSLGEVIIVKHNDQVIGMIKQSRPGKIFEESEDKHFYLKNIKAKKKDIGYISWLAVAEGYQGEGIGKKLVREALKYQKEWGSKAVVVHCWQASPGNASQKLFKKMGFSSLKMHIRPWGEYSKNLGAKKYWCVVCGNPCFCDELEMIKYI